MARSEAEGAGCRAEFEVSGMTCQNCVRHVREEVAEIPGVTSVEVSLEGGRMVIVSSAPIATQAVAAALAEAGDYGLAEA